MRTVLQTEASECGLACLAMISSAFGGNDDLADIRRRFSISLKGATLAQLIRHADALNFSCRPIRLEIEEIGQLQLPCILHWNLNHFVVLKRVSKNWQGRKVVVILDPAIGERRLTIGDGSDPSLLKCKSDPKTRTQTAYREYFWT